MAPASVDKEAFNRRLIRLYSAWKVRSSCRLVEVIVVCIITLLCIFCIGGEK